MKLARKNIGNECTLRSRSKQFSSKCVEQMKNPESFGKSPSRRILWSHCSLRTLFFSDGMLRKLFFFFFFCPIGTTDSWTIWYYRWYELSSKLTNGINGTNCLHHWTGLNILNCASSSVRSVPVLLSRKLGRNFDVKNVNIKESFCNLWVLLVIFSVFWSYDTFLNW